MHLRAKLSGLFLFQVNWKFTQRLINRIVGDIVNFNYPLKSMFLQRISERRPHPCITHNKMIMSDQMSELRSNEVKHTFIPASALLAMHSIYIGQLLRPAAAPLIMCIRTRLGAVAIMCDYPHPAQM